MVNDALPSWLSRHAIALIAYLSTRREQSATRNDVLQLLWSVDESRARHSLSQLLYTINHSTETPLISTFKNRLSLQTSNLDVDYISFQKSISAQDYSTAVSLYSGEFLLESAFVTEQFDDWRIAMAAEIQAKAKAACAALLSDARENYDQMELASLSARGLIIDPGWEQCARLRIEALVSLGKLAEASSELETVSRNILELTGKPSELLGDDLKQAISVIRLPSSQPESTFFMPAVGRQQEIAEIMSLWNDAESCRVGVIEGEPGIGKSRLLDNVLRRIVLRGARVFHYTCSEVEARLPYSALAGLLREGHQGKENATIEPMWETALNSIVPEMFASFTQPETIPQRLIWEAVAQFFLTRCTTQRVLVVIDNYHWMDDLSREVLIYVTKRLKDHQIVFLHAGRPPLGPTMYEDDRAMLKRIVLSKLDPCDVERLFDEFERRYSLSLIEGVRKTLSERSHGHPYYLVESLREIAQAGDGSVVPSAVASSSITSNVASRLQRITPNGQALAYAAAILNSETSLSILAEVVGLNAVESASAADELVSSGILLNATRVQFAHDLIREAVDITVPAVQRSLWHSRLASVLSEHEPDSVDAIARHYDLAGLTRKAFEYSEVAGKRAIQLEAYASATEHYARMLRTAPSSERPRALTEIARLHARTGQYNRLSALLPEMETAFSRNSDNQGLLICATARLYLAQESGMGLQSLTAEAKRLLSLANSSDSQQLAAALWQVADLLRRSREYALMQQISLDLQELSKSVSSSAAADMLALSSVLVVPSHGYENAWPLAVSAVELANSSGSRLSLANSLFARGTVNLLRGEMDDANADYSDSLLLAEQLGLEHRVHASRANLAVVLLEQSRFTEAEEHAQRSLREIGFARRAYAFGNLALIRLRSGDLPGALHYAHSLAESHKLSPQPWIPVHAEALLGLIELYMGKTESALARAEYVRNALSDGDSVTDTSHIHVLVARAEHLVGRTDAAIRLLSEAAAALKPKDHTAAARLSLESAHLYCALGDHTVARSVAGRIHDHALRRGALLIANEAQSIMLATHR
jgi:predicted ATPase/DNA-binding SARP family transcriptional activator